MHSMSTAMYDEVLCVRTSACASAYFQTQNRTRNALVLNEIHSSMYVQVIRVSIYNSRKCTVEMLQNNIYVITTGVCTMKCHRGVILCATVATLLLASVYLHNHSGTPCPTCDRTNLPARPYAYTTYTQLPSPRPSQRKVRSKVHQLMKLRLLAT